MNSDSLENSKRIRTIKEATTNSNQSTKSIIAEIKTT